MWIKRKDLELMASALLLSKPKTVAGLISHTYAIELVETALGASDPVDVVPVHDYPFKLPGTEGPI